MKWLPCVRPNMLRAILPDADMECEDFEHGESGVDLYDENGDMIAFVPYGSLIAIINEDADVSRDEPSIAD